MILRSPVVYRSFTWNGALGTLYPNASSTAWKIADASPLPGLAVNGLTAYLLCNNGPSDIKVRFGVSATAHIDAHSHDSILIPAQQSVLVDESESSAGVWTSSQAIWLATLALSGPGKLTVYSGVTRKMVLFQDLGASTDPGDLINSSGGNPLWVNNGEVTITQGINTTEQAAIVPGTPS